LTNSNIGKHGKLKSMIRANHAAAAFPPTTPATQTIIHRNFSVTTGTEAKSGPHDPMGSTWTTPWQFLGVGLWGINSTVRPCADQFVSREQVRDSGFDTCERTRPPLSAQNQPCKIEMLKLRRGSQHILSNTLFPSLPLFGGYCQFRMRDFNPGIEGTVSKAPPAIFTFIQKPIRLVRDQAFKWQRLAVRAKRVRALTSLLPAHL